MELKNIKRIYIFVIQFLSATVVRNHDDFLRLDNRGGLVLPFGGKTYADEDWLEYQRLTIDESVKSINPSDLPIDFCDDACRLVDEFRRKTVNEKVEWMLYFDYTNGDVIYCWKGEKGRIVANFKRKYLAGKNIASIHSHSSDLYSFPSSDNFDILENDFEDYEIITSIKCFWIVEFKGCIDVISRREFKHKLGMDMSDIMLSIRLNCNPYDISNVTEEIMGNYLLYGINNEIQGINLVLNKKEYS